MRRWAVHDSPAEHCASFCTPDSLTHFQRHGKLHQIFSGGGGVQNSTEEEEAEGGGAFMK